MFSRARKNRQRKFESPIAACRLCVPRIPIDHHYALSDAKAGARISSRLCFDGPVFWRVG